MAALLLCAQHKQRDFNPKPAVLWRAHLLAQVLILSRRLLRAALLAGDLIGAGAGALRDRSQLQGGHKVEREGWAVQQRPLCTAVGQHAQLHSPAQPKRVPLPAVPNHAVAPVLTPQGMRTCSGVIWLAGVRPSACSHFCLLLLPTCEADPGQRAGSDGCALLAGREVQQEPEAIVHASSSAQLLPDGADCRQAAHAHNSKALKHATAGHCHATHAQHREMPPLRLGPLPVPGQ